MALDTKPCSKVSCDRVSENQEVMRGREEVELEVLFFGVVQVKQVNT